MKKFLILGLIGLLFVACNPQEENETYSFTGKVQKGPFVTGTIVALNELNSDLGQTGNTFTTSIAFDDGSFSLNNIEMNSDKVLLTATGFYFNELYGELSGATLSLQAIAELTGTETQPININVFTHLATGRVEHLVASGVNFKEANDQAKSELLSFLGVAEPFDTDFENMDISVDEDYNAALLAFSIILQRYTYIDDEKPTLTAELTQLLANLSSDFAEDGEINDQTLIDQLLNNILTLNLLDIRNNVEARYADLGQTVTIPDFEQCIAAFQEKYSDTLYYEFIYPEEATPDPIIAPNDPLPNVLFIPATEFQAGAAYSAAAIIPLNTTLQIKVIGSNITIGGPVYGWNLTDNYPDGFTLTSQKQNELMTMLLNFGYDGGSAIIEYYENTTDTPTFVKEISWQ